MADKERFLEELARLSSRATSLLTYLEQQGTDSTIILMADYNKLNEDIIRLRGEMSAANIRPNGTPDYQKYLDVFQTLDSKFLRSPPAHKLN